MQTIHTTENHQNLAKEDAALKKICPAWCALNPEWVPECAENKFLNDISTFAEFNLALDSKNKC